MICQHMIYLEQNDLIEKQIRTDALLSRQLVIGRKRAGFKTK